MPGTSVKSKDKPRLFSRRVRAAFGLFVLLVALGLVVAGCSGNGGRRTASVSRSTALTNLYEAIDSGPTWATAQVSAAARANINYAPGSNARCGYDYLPSGPDLARFVCYLRYLNADQQPESLWFRENRNGSGIVAMTQAQFRAFTANAVAYERRHGPQLVAAYWRSRPSLFKPARGRFAGDDTLAGVIAKGGSSLASRIDVPAELQPRVTGTACDGAYGVQEATPTTSILTAGDYLIAGAGTSCGLAQVVATALGDSSTPGNATLSVPDQTTGGRLTLRCHGLSQSGPVECAATGGVKVYVGSYRAPLPPTTSRS